MVRLVGGGPAPVALLFLAGKMVEALQLSHRTARRAAGSSDQQGESFLRRAGVLTSVRERGNMKIDLFELIEGLFSGVIYFFYNLVASAAAVVRHPFSAPPRLYLRHLSPQRRQVSGLTFLFMIFFVLLLVLELGDSGARVRKVGWAVFVEGDLLGGGVFWLVTLYALLATSCVDLCLRIVIGLRLRDRPLRARAVLNAVEFAMFWPLAASPVVWMAFVLAADEALGRGRPWSPIVFGAAAAAPLALAVAVIPPLAQLRGGLRRRADVRAHPASRLRQAAMLACGGALLWAATLLGLAAGMAPMLLKQLDRYEAYAPKEPSERVDLVELRCRPGGKSPAADLLLVNVSPESLLFYPGAVRLMLLNYEAEKSLPVRLALDSPAEAPVVLHPRLPTLVTLRLASNPAYRPRPGDQCFASVRVDRAGRDLFRNSRTFRIEPEPRAR